MPRTFYGPFSEKDNNYAAGNNANVGRFPMGTWLVLPDERAYRFALNDGTVEVAGNLYQSEAPVGNYTDLVVDTARAIGATQISATDGGTGPAIDLFAEGTVHVNDATGQGYAARIARANAAGQAHAAAASGTVITVNLAADESVQVALEQTTSQVTFTPNRYARIIIHPAPPTAAIAGVSPGTCAADRYYWSQTKGYAAVLATGTLLAGLPVQADITTNGSVESSKRRMRTGGTTYSILTTAVTLRFLDQDGSTTLFGAVGLASTASTVEVGGGIAYNAPYVGECVNPNATTEFALVDLKID